MQPVRVRGGAQDKKHIMEERQKLKKKKKNPQN